jgi:16S rRNA C1402 N4-methylase RsmH
MKLKLFKILLSLLVIGFVSCNSTTEKKKPASRQNNIAQKSAYKKMEIAFVGKPRESEIKPILDKIIIFHGAELNENNRERSASVLITLRKSSKNGITEMDILRQMNADGVNQFSFPEQAAISFTLLESN